MSVARFYKCLGDDTRLRCLLLLQARESLCVCDIVDALKLSQPKVSRHLAQLRGCNLVNDLREGQWVYYQLHPGLAPWQSTVLNDTWKALGEEKPFAEDLRRLELIEEGKVENRCA